MYGTRLSPYYETPSGVQFAVPHGPENTSMEEILSQAHRIQFTDEASGELYDFVSFDQRDQKVGVVYKTASGKESFLTCPQYQQMVDTIEPQRHAPEPYKRFFRGEKLRQWNK